LKFDLVQLKQKAFGNSSVLSNFIHRKTVEVRNKYKTIQWQYEKKKQHYIYMT